MCQCALLPMSAPCYGEAMLFFVNATLPYILYFNAFLRAVAAELHTAGRALTKNNAAGRIVNVSRHEY